MKKWITHLSLVVVTMTITIVLIEFYYGFKTKPQVKKKLESTGDFTLMHPKWGWQGKPNFKATETLIVDEKQIYQVDYEFDQYGRRTIPGSTHENKDRHLILMGGSNAFGQALKSKDTLIGHLIRHFPNAKDYNYSYNGYGPNHILARLEHEGIGEQIEIKKGLTLYYYAYFHNNRVRGSSSFLSWGEFSPKYEIKEDHLQYKGLFSETHPVKVRLSKWFHNLNIVKAHRWNWPPANSSYNLKLVCKTLKQIEFQLKRQLPETEFVVVTMPRGTHFKSPPCFEDGSLKHIHTGQLIQGKFPKPPDTVPWDGHFSAIANERIAYFLADQDMISNHLKSHINGGNQIGTAGNKKDQSNSQ